MRKTFFLRLIDLSGESKDKTQIHNYQFWMYVWVITMASISFGCGCTFQVYHYFIEFF